MKTKPKRIYLSKLNQPDFLNLINYLPIDPIENKHVKNLRVLTSVEKAITDKKSDFSQALAIANYVSRAWSHDGFNSNPKKQDAITILKHAKKGATFSCVQFATVFTQICHSVGIPARILQVSTKNASLGSSGHGHVTAEYFDNQFKKWVWIDPQIHAYAKSGKTPLSFNELSERILIKEKYQIIFSKRTLDYLKGDKSQFKRLENFIKIYTWSSKIIGHKVFFTKQNHVELIGCKRKNVLPAITFQGFSTKSPTYLPKELFDAPINQCQIQFETHDPKKMINWKSLDEYKKSAHLNFASSVITLKFKNNMPWFSHYEVNLNGRKRIIKNSSAPIKLKSGLNKLLITPINKANRAGATVVAEIHYDNKYKVVKNYW